MSNALQGVLQATLDAPPRDSGGTHGPKGTEFQKNWAISKMFELREQGTDDFLFLFESLQDVAILDSALLPTKIEVIQIKKKDRGEWTWNSLTMLHLPTDPADEPAAGLPRKKKISDTSASIIGKLYRTVLSIPELDVSGRFVSNAGCDITLPEGRSVAVSVPIAMSELPAHFRELLESALDAIREADHPAVDLSRLKLEKTGLSVDDPIKDSMATAYIYLKKHSPKHLEQAESFVASLLVQLSALGMKTARARTIDEMRSMHGYSMGQFTSALADLEATVDADAILAMLLDQLRNEGMGFTENVRIRRNVADIYRRALANKFLPGEAELGDACDRWLGSTPLVDPLRPFFAAGVIHLRTSFSSFAADEIMAHLLVKAIRKCAAPN